MKNAHGFGEFHYIDGTICAGRIVCHHLKYASAADAFERFGGIGADAALREVQGVAEELSCLDRQRHQVSLAASDPNKRFFGGGHAYDLPEKI